MPQRSHPRAIQRPRPAPTMAQVLPVLPSFHAPPMRRLPLGAALTVARQMLSPLKYYIRIQAHETGATIEGDTRKASEVYYFHFGSVMEIVFASQTRNACKELIRWVHQHYPEILSDDWDVTPCPMWGDMTTMIGHRDR